MDYYYLILILPAIVVSLIAKLYVNATFSRYSKVATTSGLNGRQASLRIQEANGLTVPVMSIDGSLTDCYDPRNNTIYLSEPVFAENSVAAVGVAAHETGHALQYAQAYAPIRWRAAVLPVTRIGSMAAPYLILAGVLFSFQPLAMVGVCFFGLSVLFQLLTLPVEFNASRRAMTALREGNCLTEPELAGVRKVLTAAALTYVAALLVSLMHFLRLLLLVSGKGRRRR